MALPEANPRIATSFQHRRGTADTWRSPNRHYAQLCNRRHRWASRLRHWAPHARTPRKPGRRESRPRYYTHLLWKRHSRSSKGLRSLLAFRGSRDTSHGTGWHMKFGDQTAQQRLCHPENLSNLPVRRPPRSTAARGEPQRCNTRDAGTRAYGGRLRADAKEDGAQTQIALAGISPADETAPRCVNSQGHGPKEMDSHERYE